MCSRITICLPSLAVSGRIEDQCALLPDFVNMMQGDAKQCLMTRQQRRQ
jgi:hypothetical protein